MKFPPIKDLKAMLCTAVAHIGGCACHGTDCGECVLNSLVNTELTLTAEVKNPEVITLKEGK